MSKIILCIDDVPSRYTLLARHVAPEIMIVVTHDLADVMFYFTLSDIYDIVGVCLDCDMPHGPQGYYYASNILNERNIPVVIASQNPGESLKCADVLEEYSTPNLLHPIKYDIDWVYRAMNFINGSRT